MRKRIVKFDEFLKESVNFSYMRGTTFDVEHLGKMFAINHEEWLDDDGYELDDVRKMDKEEAHDTVWDYLDEYISTCFTSNEFKKFVEENYQAIVNSVINNLKLDIHKGTIVKYDGDRYVVKDVIDNDIVLQSLKNPYGGSHSSSPMSYATFKTNIDDPKIELFET